MSNVDRASLLALVRSLEKRNDELLIENITLKTQHTNLEDITGRYEQSVAGLLALRESHRRVCDKAELVAEQRDDLKALLQGKPAVEKQLRDKIETVSKDLETTRTEAYESKRAADRLREEIEGLQEHIGILKVFAPLGVYIRSRLLEWENKPPVSDGRKNYGILDAGTHAAHFGKAQADALLYKAEILQIIPNIKVRDDVDLYSSLYGCSPTEMLKWKDVPSMVEVMDMRCSMKIYLIPEEYETSKFREFYRIAWDLLRSREDRSVEGTHALFEQQDMKSHITSMRHEYRAALNENKRRRANTRRRENGLPHTGGSASPAASPKPKKPF